MGRRKTYDRDDIVQRALLVFWQHGYEATTIGQLEKVLGVNRYSLFAEFGSKQGLFEAALGAYEATFVDAFLGPLEASGAGVAEVAAFLDGFRDVPGDMTGFGCMICNAAVEQAPVSDAVEACIQRYFTRLHAAFQHAMQHEAASALASAAVGLFVQARSGMPREVLSARLDGLVAWVRSLEDPHG